MILSATEARKGFFELIKKTNQQHEVFEIHHKSGNAVIMSADEYQSLQETLHLLSAPGFKDKFEKSVEQANNGELVDFEDVFGNVS